MKETVYVVTDVELGWDCVCGVYTTKESAIINGVFGGKEPTEEERKAFDNGETTRIVHEEPLSL